MKNAFHYHQELSQVEALISSLKDSHEKVTSAQELIDDSTDPFSNSITILTALVFSQDSITNVLSYLEKRKAELVTILSETTF